MNYSDRRKKFFYPFALAALVGLYLTTNINYLLFHTLSEFFSIVVAFSFFVITWNSRFYIKNKYLLIIGIAYLFISFVDMMHTISYKGMPVFTDYDYYANQLWIGARYMESITILLAFYYLKTKRKIHPEAIFIVYLIITFILTASIFHWKIFPECFVEGKGLTDFKIYSEYIICIILLTGLYLLFKRRKQFTKEIYRDIFLSIVFTIISELAFTFYINNYGFSNLVGHYFKIFSFYMIYKAIVETGIREPYDLIFRELDLSNKNLKMEIEKREKTEKEKEKLIDELKSALSEVKTLSGLLPICMYCKNVRDDEGYWQQIEGYIMDRSDAQFSHSICKECAEIHYPGIDISKKIK